jgi:hypothetical protein
MTLKLPEGERKRQHKSVRRAEKRRCRARMMRAHGLICPLSAGLAGVDTARSEKHLISWPTPAIVATIGKALGECRF